MKTSVLCPLVGFLMVTSPVLADQHSTDIQQSLYICERGVAIAATYINTSDGDSFAVVNAEGRQIAMRIVMSASGAKYAEATGAVPYIWWTKGNAASFYVEGADIDDDLTLFKACRTIAE